VAVEEQIRGGGVAGRLPLEGQVLAIRLAELTTRDWRPDDWTAEEDECLAALAWGVAEGWCAIGLMLRRPPVECFHRFREVCGGF
jgi:hypothetical protein